MTLEGLLTFIGVLVAVFAIPRAVQRRSLFLFIPFWLVISAVSISFILIVVRDAPFGVSPPFGWPLPKVLSGLTLGSFLIPVAAVIWASVVWRRGKLTKGKLDRVENVFRAALNEREFDEVERIVRKNQQRLAALPTSAASVLFHSSMVEALVSSYSLVHLELLANMQFLKSLENRHAAVDVVVRRLLRSDVSPLRSAVVSRYGGLEHLTHSDAEQDLLERTFQNPEWYIESDAHYPLLISSVELLYSGKLDKEYNEIGRAYETNQGISRRAHCPIYLAIKTEVLAIQAGIEKQFEKDFYVSDLSDVFSRVLERSRFDRSIWESPSSNSEFPTPYAYLLYTIADDLEDLMSSALSRATSRGSSPIAEAPKRIARDVAQIWSFCVSLIAASENNVSSRFRRSVIDRYLRFVLALGWGPSEVYRGPIGGDVVGLQVWRDLLLSKLQELFAGHASARRQPLREAFESLDRGKLYISEGYDWLEENLFSNS